MTRLLELWRAWRAHRAATCGNCRSGYCAVCIPPCTCECNRVAS